MPTCGSKGFLTKAGLPCSYNIAEKDEACPHHCADKSKAREFQTRGGLISNMTTLPDNINTNGFQTIGDLKRTLADVAHEIATNKKVDLKRMDSLVRVCGVAGSVLQTEKIDELNDVLKRAEGHGPALVILEGLKSGRTRRLPGIADRSVKVEEAS